MKVLSDKMMILLNSVRGIKRVDLYTITLTTGEILRYTSADYDLTYNGLIYRSMPINRGVISQSVGLSVDDVDVEIIVKPNNVTAGGSSLALAAQVGAFDAALISIDTAFMPDWGDLSTGVINRFQGYIDIDALTGTSLKVKAKSITEALNIDIPRNTYSPSCGYALYGSGCGVDKDAFGFPAAVLAGCTSLALNIGIAKVNNYLDLGYVLGMTGANTGAQKSIKVQVGGIVSLSSPLNTPPAVGDMFMFYPGCAGDLVSCAKFNNAIRNRSFPYVPVPEVTI